MHYDMDGCDGYVNCRGEVPMSSGGTGAKPLCRPEGGCRYRRPLIKEAGYVRADCR